MSARLFTLGSYVEDSIPEPVRFDLDRLIRTRLLLAASSGAGKSETIRKFCSLVVPVMPVFLIDPEGEFADLRESMPFVLAGPGGEAAATVATAALLAQRLLELRASAIIDIFELPPSQRHEFVRRFLEAMINAPKTLWNDVLVIVDEAHVFAPERGYPPSVASEAMASLASRGRKRGFGMMMATQRLAGLSNETAALCENQMIGRTMPQDQPAAAKLLSFTGKAERDAFGKTIRSVKDGEFFAIGQAFGLVEPTLFRVERVPGGDKRKKAAVDRSAPPTPAAIRDLLPKLADLPREAEEREKSIEELRADLKEAGKKIRELEKMQPAAPVMPKVDREEVRKMREKLAILAQGVKDAQAHAKAEAAGRARAIALLGKLREGIAAVEKALVAIPGEAEGLAALEAAEAEVRSIMPAEAGLAVLSTPAGEPRPLRARVIAREPAAVAEGDAPVSLPEQKVLNALGWLEEVGVDSPDIAAVAMLAGYKPTGGAFGAPKAALARRGWIVGMKLTEEGRRFVQASDIDRTNHGLQRAVLDRFGEPERRVLRTLIASYPREMKASEVAETAGYKPSGGAFGAPRSTLLKAGVIESPRAGYLRAKDLLFPEGV